MRRSNSRLWCLILIVGLLLVGATAWATPQQQPTSSQGQGKGLENVAPDKSEANLGLTDEQKTKIKEIRQSEHEQLKAVRQDESLTKEQKVAKTREIMKNSNAQVATQLTPEQQQKWHRWRRDRREDVRDRREDRRDRREDVADRREDRKDRREDVRDRRHDGGVRDRMEDRADRREDVRDRCEDRKDRREDKRDRREDRKDRRHRP